MAPEKFAKTALGFTKSPLGIIALFIILVYASASTVAGFGSNEIAKHATPLIYFMVLFPVVVFGGFLWLVAKHHNKLYGPSDYKDEENFLRAQQIAVESAVSLTAATAKQINSEITDTQLRAIVKNVISNAKQQSKHEKWHNRILWVDDHPENNIHERQAFEAQGIEFSLARSTDEALKLLKTKKFTAIISDMSRKEGPQEGYVLLEKLKTMGDKTPFIIYAASKFPEAKKRGALGSTNRSDKLFQIVMSTITNAS